MSIGAVTVRGDNTKCFKNKEKNKRERNRYMTLSQILIYTQTPSNCVLNVIQTQSHEMNAHK